jgi:hypothetical protein
MTTNCIDPLELGKRVMSILHTGRRTATYKLATLSALIAYCEQYAPLDDPCTSIDVHIDDLADRVIEMYWRQLEPLNDGRLLHQSSESAKILVAIEKLRGAADAHHHRRCPSAKAAQRRVHDTYQKTRCDVRLVLIEQPLPRLQHLGGGSDTAGQSFLYDEATIDRHATVSKRSAPSSRNRCS